jgi:hypothetical protein
MPIYYTVWYYSSYIPGLSQGDCIPYAFFLQLSSLHARVNVRLQNSQYKLRTRGPAATRSTPSMFTVLPSSLPIVAKAVIFLFVTAMFFRLSFSLVAASPSVVVRTQNLG